MSEFGGADPDPREAEAKEAEQPVLPNCFACGEQAAARKRCSRCKAAFYCSEECQRHHWKQHKPTCLPAAASAPAGAQPALAAASNAAAAAGLELHQDAVLNAAGGVDEGAALDALTRGAEQLRQQFAQPHSQESIKIQFLCNGQAQSLWFDPDQTVAELLDTVFATTALSSSRVMFLTRRSQRLHAFPNSQPSDLLALTAVDFMRAKNDVRQAMVDGIPVKDPENTTVAKLRRILMNRAERQVQL